jgi:hypothetical protein
MPPRAGIGGGDQWGGVEKAVDAVARNPFFGLWSAYAKSADPWSIPANAAYRRELYKLYLVRCCWLALLVLRAGPGCSRA